MHDMSTPPHLFGWFNAALFTGPGWTRPMCTTSLARSSAGCRSFPSSSCWRCTSRGSMLPRPTTAEPTALSSRTTGGAFSYVFGLVWFGMLLLCFCMLCSGLSCGSLPWWPLPRLAFFLPCLALLFVLFCYAFFIFSIPFYYFSVPALHFALLK